MGTCHTDLHGWKGDDFAVTYGDFEFLMFYEKRTDLFMYLFSRGSFEEK